MHQTTLLSALSILAVTSFAAPASEVLSKRDCDGKFGDDATSTLGDFTGCWSSYEDGSGTYVTSEDTHNYGPLGIGGDKCWTDVVS